MWLRSTGSRAEDGIDISGAVPNILETEDVRASSVAVTMSRGTTRTSTRCRV